MKSGSSSVLQTAQYSADWPLSEDFNSYATHRGDHLTAQRATFANPKLLNEMVRDENGEAKQGPLARELSNEICSFMRQIRLSGA
ncbi:aconitase A [Microbulbifer rhizosphaerae]|uniref:Aconitase A n=1 Tax=Microbulbifer rhizosphaerae TaxID=1562603 RepID=A0A7W4WBW5_9GAMM|nr:aconitase A [Microbulbifer rhizosphaerae]